MPVAIPIMTIRVVAGAAAVARAGAAAAIRGIRAGLGFGGRAGRVALPHVRRGGQFAGRAANRGRRMVSHGARLGFRAGAIGGKRVKRAGEFLIVASPLDEIVTLADGIFDRTSLSDELFEAGIASKVTRAANNLRFQSLDQVLGGVEERLDQAVNLQSVSERAREALPILRIEIAAAVRRAAARIRQANIRDLASVNSIIESEIRQAGARAEAIANRQAA